MKNTAMLLYNHSLSLSADNHPIWAGFGWWGGSTLKSCDWGSFPAVWSQVTLNSVTSKNIADQHGFRPSYSFQNELRGWPVSYASSVFLIGTCTCVCLGFLCKQKRFKTLKEVLNTGGCHKGMVSQLASAFQISCISIIPHIHPSVCCQCFMGGVSL